jgi:hypothetical protein
MNGNSLSALHESRRKRIAACIASIFCLASPTATLAATVTSCLDDGGGGTLRSIVTGAAEGATIDFAGLDCTATSNTITLASAKSYITIAQNSLTIDGSGAVHPLSIDASGLYRGYISSRVLTHTGTGTLTVKNLTLENGYILHDSLTSYGGCLWSAGNVTLDHATVTNCTITHTGGVTPTGGAVYTKGNLTLLNSTVSNSSATGTDNTGASGGGVFVKGDLSLNSSSISYNTASAGTGDALGGGAYVAGKLNISTTGKYTFINNNSVSSSSGGAKGGGAFTVGDFYTQNRGVIIYNSASAPGQLAAGGGLYVGGALTLKTSFLSYDTASGSTSFGGGAFVSGNSSISYTSVKYNKAYGPSLGAGLYLTGATNTITSSTISNNTAGGNVAGVCAIARGAGVTFELKNSTISNNYAAGVVGGMYADPASVKLWNSTIAFNTAGSSGSGFHSPGVELSAYSNAMGANLQSTLISNNSVGAYQLDLTTYPNTSSVTFNGGALAIPANNFVRATLVTNLPTDTKHDDCPLLGPLRNNGGLTNTHALLSHSPAIDTGNDSSLLGLYDQRGSAAVNGTLDYTRFSGMTALADIGAYEVQQNDIVFNTDFDGCLPLSF